MYETFEEQYQLPSPAQAARQVNHARANLTQLQSEKAAWAADGQARIIELMSDNTTRMDQMRRGRQLDHAVVAADYDIRTYEPIASAFYESVGKIALMDTVQIA